MEDRKCEIINNGGYKEDICFTELDENGLLITLDNYHEVLIPKDCMGFTDRAYEDFAASGISRYKIRVEEGNPKYKAVDNCLIEIEAGKVVLGCKTSVIPRDGSIKIIGAHAFNGVKVTDDENADNPMADFKITLPQGVEIIEHHAFADSDLTDIEFSDELKEIGSMAFMLTKLGKGGKRVHLPYTVEKMGIGVFAGCKELSRIFINSNRYKTESDAIVDTETKTIIAVHNGNSGEILPYIAEKTEALTFFGQAKGRKYYFDDHITEIKKFHINLPSAMEFPIIMKVRENSYAHQFAMEHNIPFEIW